MELGEVWLLRPRLLQSDVSLAVDLGVGVAAPLASQFRKPRRNRPLGPRKSDPGLWEMEFLL